MFNIMNFKDNHSNERELIIPIYIIAELTNTSQSSNTHKDISENQSIRDVERDVVYLNNSNKLLKGSIVGYDGVIVNLINEMKSLFPVNRIKEMGTTISLSSQEQSINNDIQNNTLGDENMKDESMFKFNSLFNTMSSIHDNKTDNETQDMMDNILFNNKDDAILSEYAKSLLRAVNRTESGHWSFALVSALCSNINHLSIVVPDSTAATPLHIDLSLGALTFRNTSNNNTESNHHHDVYGYGLRAYVKTSTVYDIYDSECVNVMFRMKATFSHKLVLPLGQHFSPNTIQGRVGWERLGPDGSISISLERIQ